MPTGNPFVDFVFSQTPANSQYNQQLYDQLAGLAGGDSTLKSAFESGLGLSGLGSPTASPESGFFSFGSLGRVAEEQDPRITYFLDKLQQDLTAPAQSSESSQAISQLSRAGNTPIFQGKIPDEIINGIRQQIATAGTPTRYEQEVIDRRRAGLDGLTAPENTALRESAQEGLDRSFQTNLRSGLAANNIAGRAGGANAQLLRDLNLDSLQANRGLSRDILLANIDEKNRRLNEYQGLATGLSDRAFNRRLQNRDLLSNLMLNRDVATGQQQLSSADALNRSILDRDRFLESARANRFATYGNSLFAANQDALNRRLQNLNQLAKEKQGQIGLLFGAGQFGAAQSAQNQSFNLANSGLNSINSFEIPEFQFPEFPTLPTSSPASEPNSQITPRTPTSEDAGGSGNNNTWNSAVETFDRRKRYLI